MMTYPTTPSPLPSSMRALTQSRYGGTETLAMADTAVPTPQPGEVLLRVAAASLARGDLHLLSGTPYLVRLMGYGLRRPKHPIPGHAVAGTVVACGEGVEGFPLGTAVYGEVNRGACAEYVAVPAPHLAKVPESLSMEEAAAVPVSAPTALVGLRDIAGLKQGQHVLINGASGGVGSYAIQIAKQLGARATAVVSSAKIDQARRLGADDVVDYTHDDFAEQATRYDVMFDIVGNRSRKTCRRVLKPQGVYVACAGKMGNWIGPITWMLGLKLASLVHRQRMATYVQSPRASDLEALHPHFASGTIRPVIEATYPLEDAVAAFERAAKGHARGKLVVSMP